MEPVGDFEYHTKDLIGHGAFAIVYKGRHRKKPNFPVAIKVIMRKSIQKSNNLLGKEIKILKELTELHHENVVELLDCKESNASYQLVMEYCNGGDLAEYLQSKGPLDEHTIQLFMIQLAGAMKALVAKGIVHRDLKPQNILLSHNCKDKHPPAGKITLKIADFGFARFLREGNMAATLCGSPMYMAPEVIMSKHYDAKADLWSLGTIVFQCLTGKAPFNAHTPQELKIFYEKNANLAPKIPSGTSIELCNLLKGLLRRNPQERIDFEVFFNHAFLQRPQQLEFQSEVPIPLASLTLATPTSQVTLETNVPITDIDESVATLNNNSINQSPTSSPDNSDDFVFVPNNIPTDPICGNYDKPKSVRTPLTFQNIQASPPRPSSLPISEPKPVPSIATKVNPQNHTHQTSTAIPRSQPINMRRRDSNCDINSISPSSKQATIGTPPNGSRRRSTSGGSDTPPPPSTWQVSPGSYQSPLRRFEPHSPIVSGALSRLAPISSPTLINENNNPLLRHARHGLLLPDMSQSNQLHSLLQDTSTHPDQANFRAPELPAETLLDREHNETLAKLNFVVALTECIVDVADSRCAPLSALMSADAPPLAPHAPENCKRAERLVLLIRALSLLESGLNLGSQQLAAGKLLPSHAVKSVIERMRVKYNLILNESKKLNGSGLLQRANASNITADHILFDYAVQTCQAGALDELFGNQRDSFSRYQSAHILLHSLYQKCNNSSDKILLAQYKDAVEKRLLILQQQESK